MMNSNVEDVQTTSDQNDGRLNDRQGGEFVGKMVLAKPLIKLSGRFAGNRIREQMPFRNVRCSPIADNQMIIDQQFDMHPFAFVNFAGTLIGDFEERWLNDVEKRSEARHANIDVGHADVEMARRLILKVEMRRSSGQISSIRSRNLNDLHFRRARIPYAEEEKHDGPKRDSHHADHGN